eukprot:TRINITY_DN32645_c0_g4_i7.p4 TRINITY_DN32645_c0_g4~~TRINITY_DN32645_c0_g4_i7.p4  ORF type:complete len:128 (+),score=13.97 TRINITY_DN32645_c0_g4_i7:364-747(+)
MSKTASSCGTSARPSTVAKTSASLHKGNPVAPCSRRVQYLPEPTLEDLGIVEEREDFTHQEQVGARLEAELEAAIAGLAKQIAQSKDSGLDAATQARMLKLAPRVKDLQLCPIAGTLPDGFRHSRLS